MREDKRRRKIPWPGMMEEREIYSEGNQQGARIFSIDAQQRDSNHRDNEGEEWA